EDSDQQVTLNLLELGPRLHYYFSPERNWFISATYNFQSKGTGLLNGETATITGTGSIGSLGYHYKVTKALGIGASISYHSVVITSRKVDDTDSEVTETYNSIVPMLEFAWRFR